MHSNYVTQPFHYAEAWVTCFNVILQSKVMGCTETIREERRCIGMTSPCFALQNSLPRLETLSHGLETWSYRLMVVCITKQRVSLSPLFVARTGAGLHFTIPCQTCMTVLHAHFIGLRYRYAYCSCKTVSSSVVIGMCRRPFLSPTGAGLVFTLCFLAKLERFAHLIEAI